MFLLFWTDTVVAYLENIPASETYAGATSSEVPTYAPTNPIVKVNTLTNRPHLCQPAR